MKIKTFLNNIFLYGLFFLCLFTLAGQSSADYENCGINFQEPYWVAQNNDGSTLLIVDNNGNMDIISQEVHLNTIPLESVYKSLIITNQTNAKVFIFNNFRAYIKGDVLTEQSNITNGDGANLIIQNSLGLNVARFETDTGDIYLAGNVCYPGAPEQEATSPAEPTVVIDSDISACEELQKIGDPNYPEYPLDGDYVLTANIDCSDTVNWNNGAGFDPIGTDNDTSSGAIEDIDDIFTGTFDGQGYAINNLTINRPNEFFIGLFMATKDAEIKNLNLTNVNINGKTWVGGLIGAMVSNSYVDHCYITGNITGSVSGGLVGRMEDSSVINNSGSSVDISGESNVGGLVGSSEIKSEIINSFATGVVTSASSAGGLISNNDGTINNSYATGNVSGNRGVGGIAAYNDGIITNSYATGNVSDSDYLGWVGGLIGTQNGTQANTEDCRFNYQTTGQNDAIGVHNGGSTSYDNVFLVYAFATFKMQEENTYSSWDFVNIWTIDEGNTYPCHKWWTDLGNTCPAI